MTNVKVFADKQRDGRTDGQTDWPKTICPRSIDAEHKNGFFEYEISQNKCKLTFLEYGNIQNQGKLMFVEYEICKKKIWKSQIW